MTPGNGHGTRPWVLDAVILVVLSAGTAFASERVRGMVPAGISAVSAGQIWFGAPIPEVQSLMTTRGVAHSMTEKHPLLPLVTTLPVFALHFVAKLSFDQAVTIVVAVTAGLWAAAFFVLLRLIGCRPFDALIFAIVGLTSASFLFWFAVPETAVLGSLSMLIALGLIVVALSGKAPLLCCTLAAAASMSMANANGLVGFWGALVQLPWRRSIQVLANALCLVTVLWSAEKVLFPQAAFFLPWGLKEPRQVERPTTERVVAVGRALVLHGMTMPSVLTFEPSDQHPFHKKLTIQKSRPGSASWWGAGALAAWTALLFFGLVALVAGGADPRLRWILALVLPGQYALNLLWGDETFRSSLSAVPLLLVVAALATISRWRPIVVCLAAVLIVLNVVNNGFQLNEVVKTVGGELSSARYQVFEAIRQRPGDPWPRGQGHVVLAEPGTREADKSYHEPGGSFSPRVGSFGVSIWLTDDRGALKATSDDIPLEFIKQNWSWPDPKALPLIETETPDYRCQWSCQRGGRWTVELQPTTAAGRRAQVVLRGVGPAAGPVRSLNWDGTRLAINDRWSVRSDPPPVTVVVGHEGEPDWKTRTAGPARWRGEDGWGFARLDFAGAPSIRLTIDDAEGKAPPELTASATRSALDVSVPDERFTRCLNAQVAHLMMGLVDRETRPGEPTAYPLNWLRDGAYVIVALSRAGRLDTARELATAFAEHDFFGGFGAEADGPGLALWALDEVAAPLGDPQFDRWLWPHVRRKAELIEAMLDTDRPIRKPPFGPLVPSNLHSPDVDLVCQASRDGLIVGRMDGHYPILFVNAVSYCGLLSAAHCAARVGEPALAQHWRDRAAAIKKAWEAMLSASKGIENGRTFICGLWPTWIAGDVLREYAAHLDMRWDQAQTVPHALRVDAAWTYFEFAEIHQGLFLGRTDRIWKTINWFCDHDDSPGLYSWWEGYFEGNSSARWQSVRGWIAPPTIAPHYWSAAELLCLQLDMLGYCDLTSAEPTLVVGAGVLPAWLSRPMHVRGLRTRHGEVAWEWNKGTMRVRFSGKPLRVRLGRAFPGDAVIRIEGGDRDSSPGGDRPSGS